MIPEVQLMLRVERDAEMQRRPTWKECGNYMVFERLRPSVQMKQVKHMLGRFTVVGHTLNGQHQGAPQGNCAD